MRTRAPALCTSLKTLITPLGNVFTSPHDLAQTGVCLRREPGQLADCRTAGSQRRCQRSDEEHDRRVPGRDDAGDPSGFTEKVVV